MARVQAQLAEARETTPGATARATVSLRRNAAGATGSFELTRGDGSRYLRELSAESCDAAAQGLAFVLAYALGGGEPEAAPVPELDGQSAPAAAPTVAPAPTPALAPVAAPTPAPAPPPQLASAPRPTWRYGLAAQLGARTGLGPIWTPVEVGVLDVRRTGRSAFEPVLRAGVAHGEPIMRVERVGSTRFSWLGARIEVCPVQLRMLGTLRLLPCAGAHVGRLVAVGQPSAGVGGQGRRANTPWLDGLGGLRLELELLRVLEVEAQGELLLPFTRYRFAFDNPETPVYQVPGLAFAGFLGLGMHFP